MIANWWYWILDHGGAVINSVGLLLDIVGAWLVALEVVHQYRGKKHQSSDAPVVGGVFAAGGEVTETPDYSAWEARKYFWMKAGLVCLTLGFVLQIISTWCR